MRAIARRRRPSFRTLSVHESRALLLYGIERRVPLQVVIGKAGSGKTRLLGALSRTAIEGATLLLSRELPTSFEAAMEMIAPHFDVGDRPGESPFERLARLADVLAERRRSGRLVALLIDDAHLAAADALRGLRMVAGTDAEGGALLPIVLAGRPELVARLEAPELAWLQLAVGTQIELLRPLPIDPAPEVAEQPVRSRDRTAPWWVATAAALTGVALATGLVVRTRLSRPMPPRSPLANPIREPSPPERFVGPPRPTEAGAVPSLLASPLAAPSEGGRFTADAVRSLVARLATAIERRDTGRLKPLLARDARQNGVRGRDAILESYAYRFTRVDSPTVIGSPGRITLREGMALADVPFETAYRDAAGTAGTVSGTLSLRIVRHGERLVLDTLDYAFGTPGT